MYDVIFDPDALEFLEKADKKIANGLDFVYPHYVDCQNIIIWKIKSTRT